jgi:hypothetical protein
MPRNQQKIIKIILDECESIEEKCDGYKEELTQVIVEIFQYERAHRVSKTDIQKKINDKFNAVARFLVKQRSHNMDTEDQTS